MDRLRRKREATEREEEAGEHSGNGSMSGTSASESAKDEWTRQTNLKIARGEIRPLGGR
jgi:hypothetical protein